MKWMKSSEEKALEWGVSRRTVNDLCNKGKISGAIKKGRVWQIPDDAVRPADGRILSGRYSIKVNKKECCSYVNL